MTCTVKSVCDQMAEETDRDILLCYYNKLVENINSGGSNKTSNDETCARTLAAKISADIQNGLGQKNSTEMYKDMTNLVENFQDEVGLPMDLQDINNLVTSEEDSNVLSNMKRSHAIFWLIFMCFVLSIVIYLWNFK